MAAAGRPLFLKIVYHGPRAMEELVAYDPHLVVGILGGGAGTTYDAFKLLAEAQKYGARAALFGRKINNAESQLAFVEFLRRIADGEITPEEAVRAYHGVLEKLEDQAAALAGRRHAAANRRDELRRRIDQRRGARRATCNLSPPVHGRGHGPRTWARVRMADAGPKNVIANRARRRLAQRRSAPDSHTGLRRMTQAEKLAYNQERRNRILRSVRIRSEDFDLALSRATITGQRDPDRACSVDFGFCITLCGA